MIYSWSLQEKTVINFLCAAIAALLRKDLNPLKFYEQENERRLEEVDNERQLIGRLLVLGDLYWSQVC